MLSSSQNSLRLAICNHHWTLELLGELETPQLPSPIPRLIKWLFIVVLTISQVWRKSRKCPQTENYSKREKILLAQCVEWNMMVTIISLIIPDRHWNLFHMRHLFRSPLGRQWVSRKIFATIPSSQNSKQRLKGNNEVAYTQEAAEPGFNPREEDLEPGPWSKSRILRVLCWLKAIEYEVYF